MTRSASRLVLMYVVIVGGVMIMFDVMAQVFGASEPAFLQLHLVLDVATVLVLYIIMYRSLKSRDRAEERLRASEQRLANLVDTAPDAIIALDADQHIFLFNQSAEKTFGFAAAEVLGQPMDQLLPDRFVARHREHVRAFGAGDDLARPRHLRPEIVGRRKDGREFPAEASLSRLSLGNEVAYFAIVHDITYRKEAEAAVRERETAYRSIFEASSDGLMISTFEGRIVEANPAFCAMHQYNYGEINGQSIRQFLHPAHRHLMAECAQTVRGGAQFAAQAIHLRRDDTAFHVEVRGIGISYHGEPHVLVGVHDISVQVEAVQLLEQRVHERTRELSTLLDISHDIASTLELQPLLGLILDQLRPMVDYTGALVLEIDGERLVPLDYRGPLPLETILRTRPHVLQATLFQELSAARLPLIIRDTQNGEPLALHLRVLTALTGWLSEARSWLGVPLMVKENIIGFLSFEQSTPGYYTAQHAQLALAIANQAAVAIENARFYQQTQRLAALEERQHLARELHDSLSQTLYGIALGAHTAQTWLNTDRNKTVEALNYVLNLADAGMTEMRALIFELRPESLAIEGLIGALTKQVAAVRARHAIEVCLAHGDEPEVPLDIKEAIYRTAQEALHNTVKHANASRLDVTLVQTVQGVELDIQDDGVGFDATADYPGHLGLKSMRERAVRLGGTLTIESAAGRGTHLHAEFPASAVTAS